MGIQLNHYSDNRHQSSISMSLYISRVGVSQIYSSCTRNYKEVIGCVRSPGKWINLSITQTNKTLEVLCNNITISIFGAECGEILQYGMVIVVLYGEILDLYNVMYQHEGLNIIHIIISMVFRIPKYIFFSNVTSFKPKSDF